MNAKNEFSYKSKLKDPRWQRKRLEIMQRDDFTCKYCSDQETSLQIHHLSYSGEPWEVENDQLVTLCEDCHKFVEYCNTMKFKLVFPIEKITYKDGTPPAYLMKHCQYIDGESRVLIFFGWDGSKFSCINSCSKLFYQKALSLIDIPLPGEELL